MSLATAVQGGRRPSQVITWLREDGTAENLSGATLTGKLLQLGDSASRAITGNLAVVDGAAGQFRWDYSEADVATPGMYRVEFSASFGSSPTPAKTFAAAWQVTESLP